MRKLSPVADCLHLQFYRDSKDRFKNAQTKASLSLQKFLGVESGFTLDKESNTIAIICQDVTVVLAFDTRERLIQWQVKISNNLGDDIQYMVLVSSVPPKSKLASGPARMHIQDKRFCITNGMPPRLMGLWCISHLRRYGVIDGRFAFEGGSSCGKGEGLFVFVSDQSADISQTFKLAAQSRLANKKRPMFPKTSLRKQLESDMALNEICDIQTDVIGYEDTEAMKWKESFDDSDTFPRMKSKIERCMSCISKLGALSMSRSSTAAATPGLAPNPCWPTTETQRKRLPSFNTCHQLSRLDSISIESHGGSSNSSEYSIPRLLKLHSKTPTSPLSCLSPELAPKSVHNQPVFLTSKPPAVGPYENYDVPKTPFIIDSENYDQPKNFSRVTSPDVSFANYDQPLSISNKTCSCKIDNPPTASTDPVNYYGSITDCTCHRVMSWADKWITLPYCRRGSGIENTAVPINRFRLSGEGKMPVQHMPSELPIYAKIDVAKKIGRRLNPDPSEEEPTTTNSTQLNYVNIDFEKSLKFYENSKQILTNKCCNEVINKTIPVLPLELQINKPSCRKCGHSPSPLIQKSCENFTKEMQDDYMIMEPGLKSTLPCLDDTNCNTLPLPSKGDVLRRLLEYKSSSNPTLIGPAVDRSRKHLIYIKKSSSAESLNTVENIPATDEVLLHQNYETESFDNDNNSSSAKASVVSSETEETSSKSLPQKYIRRSASVPFRTHNRDSSSSYDSGVSTGSLRHQRGDFNDIELPASNSISVIKYQQFVQKCQASTAHSTVPRRSKSSDPLKEISFQFQKIQIPEKSTSAEAAVPLDTSKLEGYSHVGNSARPPMIDSRSTSSRTSDMSDIETLSLSSHSSADTHDAVRHQSTSTLRPRSGEEYQNIDRSLIFLQQTTDLLKPRDKVLLPQHRGGGSGGTTFIPNYANISPVPENT